MMVKLRSIIHSIPTSNSYNALVTRKKNYKHEFRVVAEVPNLVDQELLIVVGGGAAGIYGAIRAKSLAPHLNVLVVEKGIPLSKVKISGGGRCNVTNGHFHDSTGLAENYPRGHREMKGSYFNVHSPMDTISWFSENGVPLKVEDDGRVFPTSNSSSSVIECLLSKVNQLGGKVVTQASFNADGKFTVKLERRTAGIVENKSADYLFIATGSSQQGYKLARQLNHSIIDPVPSLFTFKIDDSELADLSGITFDKVGAKLKFEHGTTKSPHFKQVGSMLITHWGLSGPVVLRLSAWGARALFKAGYKVKLEVDFTPDFHVEEVKAILSQCKHKSTKQKLVNSYPTEFNIVKRFWKYLLGREGLSGDLLWSSMSNSSLESLAHLLKNCTFLVTGKGQFKDEFVTAGGIPLSEICMDTMESRKCPKLYFAGEVLNVDGVTGGFNFQNAWSGSYIAGTSIGQAACEAVSKHTML